MTTLERTKSPADLLIWAVQNRHLVQSLDSARKFAASEAKRVGAYARPLLAYYGFLDCDGQVITDGNRLYLIDPKDDDRCNEFYEALHDLDVANGWTGERGICPYLHAESKVRDAENAIVESGKRFAGIATEYMSPQNRRKMLDIFIGACQL